MADIKIRRTAEETTFEAEGVDRLNEGFIRALFGLGAAGEAEAQAGTGAAETRSVPASADLCRFRQIHACGGYISPATLARYKAESRLYDLLGAFDEIDVPLQDGGAVTAVCAWVNESRARFVFKDCWDEAVMNEENTNKTGYYGSCGRKHVLEGIWPELSKQWRDIIVPRKLVEIVDGERVEYMDPLWLPSATDVFGTPEGAWWKDEGENFQLPIFKRERGRVKECEEKGTYPWWLRSVYASSTSYFCDVNTDGSAYITGAYRSYGFAPGFDI